MPQRNPPSDRSKPHRAKLFWNGRSQAVRLPKDFRFAGDEVEIRREGDSVILDPVKGRSWPDGYWDWLDLNRAALDLDVDALGGTLLDPALDDE
jgi:antitoxin VapB